MVVLSNLTWQRPEQEPAQNTTKLGTLTKKENNEPTHPVPDRRFGPQLKGHRHMCYFSRASCLLACLLASVPAFFIVCFLACFIASLLACVLAFLLAFFHACFLAFSFSLFRPFLFVVCGSCFLCVLLACFSDKREKRFT